MSFRYMVTGSSILSPRRNATVGAVGPIGPTGPQGAQGKMGAAGAQGPQGKMGATGAQGPQGKVGATGAPGAQGPQGKMGAQGPAGDAVVADPPCFDNTNRYADCGNGTVTDQLTGLIWTKNATCLGSGNWSNSSAAAAALMHGSCGLSDNSSPGDWRLPTIDEWTATWVPACR